MGDFRRLKAWQLSQAVVCDVYRLTAAWPSTERYGLTSQVRRAAISVPSNLAEGAGRLTEAEFRRFVRIARGSNRELLSQLLLSIDLGFSTPELAAPVVAAVEKVGAVLSGLLRSRRP